MEDIIKLSNLIENPAPTSCPGCGHLLFFRLIREVINEMGLDDKTLHCNGIGCTGVVRPWLNHATVPLLAHGRAAAVATGAKLTNPDTFVYTFQGDGDAYVIGLAETLNAAYRNENISVFISNNTLYALTGGQLSWTTLPEQVTTSSPFGRDCAMTGKPLHVPEMIANEFPDVAYVARGTMNSVKNIIALKKMVRNAIEAQMNGEGYSMVECLSVCQNNWHMSPLEARKHIDNVMIPEYPIGEFKKRKDL